MTNATTNSLCSLFADGYGSKPTLVNIEIAGKGLVYL
jgi:hypothetical protein